MHCMIDLDCYKVMCWKGKAVWWDMGMSFSRWDTGDMDSWLVNLGLGATVYLYAFCCTIIFFKLLWFLLEEITTTHESIYLEQRVARRCLTTFQIVYLYKSLKTWTSSKIARTTERKKKKKKLHEHAKIHLTLTSYLAGLKNLWFNLIAVSMN